MKKIIEKINQEQMKRKLPNFRVGDTVTVHVKIIEGDKERLQSYSGTLIAKQGSGINSSIRVRRISFGEGVERVFLLHSPRIEKIEVTKIGDVRRAKLYYLRDRVGKRGKIHETRRLVVEGESATPLPDQITGPDEQVMAPSPESAVAASPTPEESKKAR